MSSYLISGLYIYPVKSLAGIAMNEVALCPTGFVNDRRWMLVDREGRFISQREHHDLCLFLPHYSPDGFMIRYQSDELLLPFTIDNGERIAATIWDDTVEAIVAGDSINEWFSTRMNRPVRLVYMPDESKRSIEDKYKVSNDDVVSFADGYPVLAIGEAALALLQSKVQEELPMNRFRPNLVFTGGNAHDEDTWKHFSINGLDFYGVKPCGRCVITTIDQQTGKAGMEPLKTLATYRRQEQKILFGQNIISPANGSIRIGDPIAIIETTDQFLLQ
jgi:uncharacterized protein YcbX